VSTWKKETLKKAKAGRPKMPTKQETETIETPKENRGWLVAKAIGKTTLGVVGFAAKLAIVAGGAIIIFQAGRATAVFEMITVAAEAAEVIAA
jgi:hypothetical protein